MASCGVSRGWVYKLLARYDTEGNAAFEPRSRPVPLVTQFPFPSWATRAAEAGANPKAIPAPADPIEGLPR